MLNKVCIKLGYTNQSFISYFSSQKSHLVSTTNIVDYISYTTHWCVFNSVSSFLQTQLSPWVWYSSWYLFFAHHTHSFMSMWLAPSAGKHPGFESFSALMDTTSSCVNVFYSVVFV